MAQNTTPYRPDLPTTHAALSHLIEREPWAQSIWRQFVSGRDTRPDYATALELILLTLAYQRDEARRELESLVLDRREDARGLVAGQRTQTAKNAGEHTQVAR